jgi:ornithine--oxo-acid transaminase
MSTPLPWGRRYLMCPPTHFDVAYAINPWMDLAAPVDRERAQRQWDALAATLRDAGAEVELLDPVAGLPDLVFTANLGLVDGAAFIPARMRHAERRAEPAHAEAWFEAHGYETRRLGDGVVQEGAGDALPFGAALVAGYRTRSSAAAYAELARLVAGRIVPLELVDERLYHVDIAFCPLTATSALIAPGAFDEDGRRLLGELVPDPIWLTEAETQAFCANAVVVGRTVVMPACTPRLELELRERGLEPVVVDVSEFLKSGGGPRCLTLALDVRLGQEDAAAVAERHTAHNYHPLPVTVTSGEGVWVRDDHGRRYLDALSAYSALNFGHRHPRLVAAARDQLDRVTLTSRAFSNDQLGPFARELAALCGKDRVLPMNTGAEAVETAIKTARKWGYEVKGVAPGTAKILVCDGNFHGRTTTIVSFSDDPLARAGYGPFTPGFERVPFGDADALAAALAADENVVGFLVEPIQGEAGVVIPPDGYLRAARRLCSEHGALLIADEIQAGLGRTGRTFACDHEDVVPDLYVLGKALGGGIVALSAVVGDDDVLGVFGPGSHGSTFGGNPLACAVGRAVLELLATGEPQANATRLGAHLRAGLDAAAPGELAAVRSRGLWFGLDLHPGGRRDGRALCEQLLAAGVLAKDTHEHTIRLAPPLTITRDEADWLLERLLDVLTAPERLTVAAPPRHPASFAA